MTKLILAAGLCVAFLTPAGAQLAAPNAAGMRMGHVHLNVRDVDAQKKFWVEQIGARPVKLGEIEGVQIPGVLIFFRKQEPTGKVEGSVIDHLGLKVRKLDELIAKFTAAGFKVEPTRIGRENTPQSYVIGPDDFRMELVEDASISTPVAHHLHYFLKDPVAVKAWYVKTLLVKPGKRGPYEAGDVPGMNLTFAPERTGAEPTAPTRGRVLDHIGFEVKNLEDFCRRLEKNGVKFDIPYKKNPAVGIATAFFTDPWGAFIELTEGLDLAR